MYLIKNKVFILVRTYTTKIDYYIFAQELGLPFSFITAHVGFKLLNFLSLPL